MADILETIVAHKRVELAQAKERLPLSALERKMEQQPLPRPTRSMSQALAESATGIIAEMKRKSPSKGWIKEDADTAHIPADYAQAGASALSILTDEQFFGGKLEFLANARKQVSATPLLRKDFIIDPYQLFEASLAGADAVLLIAACLKPQECKDLASLAHDLNLQVLLEVHQEQELDYVGENVDMVGVNNRNLGTFHTDVQNSFRLASKLPKEFVLVSESGISAPETIIQLRQAGFRGFLIGETFMRQPNPAAALAQFIQQINAH